MKSGNAACQSLLGLSKFTLLRIVHLSKGITYGNLSHLTSVMVFLKGIAYGSGILVLCRITSRVMSFLHCSVSLVCLLKIASSVQYDSCTTSASEGCWSLFLQKDPLGEKR